jgi:transposase-like protein
MLSCNILGYNQHEYHDSVLNSRELRKQGMQHDICADFKGKQKYLCKDGTKAFSHKNIETFIQKAVGRIELIFTLVMNSHILMPVFCYRAGDRGMVC